MEKNTIQNLDFFIAERMKIVPNLKKQPNWVRNYIVYKTDAKNALREQKALNPNFDYTCLYISVLLHVLQKWNYACLNISLKMLCDL